MSSNLTGRVALARVFHIFRQQMVQASDRETRERRSAQGLADHRTGSEKIAEDLLVIRL